MTIKALLSVPGLPSTDISSSVGDAPDHSGYWLIAIPFNLDLNYSLSVGGSPSKIAGSLVALGLPSIYSELAPPPAEPVYLTLSLASPGMVFGLVFSPGEPVPGQIEFLTSYTWDAPAPAVDFSAAPVLIPGINTFEQLPVPAPVFPPSISPGEFWFAVRPYSLILPFSGSQWPPVLETSSVMEEGNFYNPAAMTYPAGPGVPVFSSLVIAGVFTSATVSGPVLSGYGLSLSFILAPYLVDDRILAGPVLPGFALEGFFDLVQPDFISSILSVFGPCPGVAFSTSYLPPHLVDLDLPVLSLSDAGFDVSFLVVDPVFVSEQLAGPPGSLVITLEESLLVPGFTGGYEESFLPLPGVGSSDFYYAPPTYLSVGFSGPSMSDSALVFSWEFIPNVTFSESLPDLVASLFQPKFSTFLGPDLAFYSEQLPMPDFPVISPTAAAMVPGSPIEISMPMLSGLPGVSFGFELGVGAVPVSFSLAVGFALPLFSSVTFDDVPGNFIHAEFPLGDWSYLPDLLILSQKLHAGMISMQVKFLGYNY